MSDFLQRINSGKTIILDGGMGSLLEQLSGSMESGEVNLSKPEVVEKIHNLYMEAGSDAITTNTFSLNGIYARKQKMDLKVMEKSLHAAMEIAVKAAAGEKYILADMGPSGEMLAPLGKGDAEEFFAAYRIQAETMAEYPIDAFFIETVFDLNEALIILNACRDTAPNIPVIFSLTFSSLKKGGCTIMGNTAAKTAIAAKEAGAAVVGANCGDLTPKEYAQIITAMKENCDLPLSIQPNAGKPQLKNGKVIYPLGAEEFAEQMQDCYDAGARLLGGCCGTTPDHIVQLAKRFKK